MTSSKEWLSFNRRCFNEALEAYVDARIKQHAWDEIAPAGLSKHQLKKETLLHDRSDQRLEELIATLPFPVDL